MSPEKSRLVRSPWLSPQRWTCAPSNLGPKRSNRTGAVRWDHHYPPLVVSIEEQLWYSTYHQFLSSTAIWYKGLRYVDNRLLMGEPHLQYEPAFATLLDEHFYQAPIILEYEADQEFLGFQVETQPLEVIYNQPRDTSQILSPTSASPPHVLLSGFRSRCHIVVKCAFPHHQKIIGIHRLTETYERAGFEFQELHKIAQSILHSLEKKNAARSGYSHSCIVPPYVFCESDSKSFWTIKFSFYSLRQTLEISFRNWWETVTTATVAHVNFFGSACFSYC